MALQYLESIALDLMKNPCAELHDLMYNVLELSERIKFSDSKPLVSDSGDKEWLTKLRELVDNVGDFVNSVVFVSFRNMVALLAVLC